MNEAAIRTKLAEINETINGPLAGLVKSADGTYAPQAHAPATKTPTSVEEILDGLRLQVRYLVFDLEATRRENKYLRQMLETRPPYRKDDNSRDDPPQT
jgi:hypothetical protein